MKKIFLTLLMTMIFGCTPEPLSSLEDLPSNYTIQDAIEDECLVIEDYAVISGVKKFEKYRNKKLKEVRIVQSFEGKEMFIFDLTFEEGAFHMTYLENGKETVKIYDSMHLISEKNSEEFGDYKDVCYLTNEDDSWEILKGDPTLDYFVIYEYDLLGGNK